MLNVKLTKEEANQTAELIDVAVKTLGLRVASAALKIIARLQQAEEVSDVVIETSSKDSAPNI